MSTSLLCQPWKIQGIAACVDLAAYADTTAHAEQQSWNRIYRNHRVARTRRTHRILVYLEI